MSTSVRCALGALLAALAALPFAPSAARPTIQAAVELGCVVVLWWGFSAHRRSVGPGWSAIGVGIGLLVLPDVVPPLVSLVAGRPESSALVDLLAAPGYLVLIGGVLRIMTAGSSAPVRGAGWTEVGILALGVMSPVFAFVVLPGLRGAHTADAVALSVYTGFACAATAMLARMVLFDRGRSWSLVFFGVSTLSSVAGGMWSLLHGGDAFVPHDSTTRVLWALTFVAVAAGMSHHSLRSIASARPGPHSTPSFRRRISVLGVGMLLPPFTMSVALALRQPPHYLWVQAFAALCVSVLALLRLAGLTRRLARQSDELSARADTDDLTGLPNRRGWHRLLALACSEALREDHTLYVAVIEIDHFSQFNQAQGPTTGDRFLRRLAADWTRALRDGERLARYGGVQFALLLPGRDLGAAVARVEQLRRLVPSPQTASAGVAAWDPDGDGDAALLHADGALYLAKCHGSDQTAAAEGTGLTLPGPLRDLQTAVQPIVRLGDGSTVAYECLSRFPHSTAIEAVFADAHEKGFGDLLEVAAICRVLGLADRPDGVEVYVNVSERAARSERFWAELPEDLTGVVVELVEQRDGLSDSEVAEVFDRFRDRGARVALDDVGSSSTDFARIAALRPDVAKIDRSLVTGCDTHAAQAEVLRMLVGFALSHGAEVVIEGVETPGELEVARAVGATYAQGYLLGRPSPPWSEPAAHLPPATRSVVPVT